MLQWYVIVVTAVVFAFVCRDCVGWKAVMSPANPKVLEGSPLEINCTLLDGVADPRFNSSDLYMVVMSTSNPSRNRRIPENFYDRSNSRTLRMVIPEASGEDDNASFMCNLDQSAYGKRVERVCMLLDVRIGRLPDLLVNISIVSFNLGRLQLSWCSNQVGVNYSLNYTNDFTKPYGPMEVSQTTDRSSPTDRFCWRSEWVQESDLCYIVIEGRNEFGSRTVHKIDFLEPRNYVKLNPAALTPLSNAPRWIYLEWRVPVSKLSRTRAIHCRLNCSSTFGSVQLEVGKEGKVNLTDLYPFTDYNVSMSCKPVNCNDCLWSDWSSVRVNTSEDVPSKSPTLLPSFYRIKDCSNLFCNVVVFWKPVSENSSNGIIEGYVVDVYESTADVSGSRSPSLTKTVNLSTTTNGYEFNVNSTARVTVKVRAFTKIGRSPSASIEIRPLAKLSKSLIKDGSFYGEQASNNRSKVLIGWKTATNVDGYVVVYCFKDEGDNLRQRRYGSDVSPPCDAETLSTERAHSNASNVTIALRSGLTLVYSIAAVLVGQSTTGLLTDWQHCIHDGSAPPAKPKVPDASCDVNGTTITLHWIPPSCGDYGERSARAEWYTAVICPENDCNPSVEHRIDKLPPSVGYHVVNGLQPETYYRIQLVSVSSTAIEGQPDVKHCRTGSLSPTQQESDSGTTTLVSLVVVLPVGIIGGMVLYIKRTKIKKMIGTVKVVPPRPMGSQPLLSPLNPSNPEDGDYIPNELPRRSSRILPPIEDSPNNTTSSNSSNGSSYSIINNPNSLPSAANYLLTYIPRGNGLTNDIQSIEQPTVDNNNNCHAGDSTTPSNRTGDISNSSVGHNRSTSDEIEPYPSVIAGETPASDYENIELQTFNYYEGVHGNVDSQGQQSSPFSSSSQPVGEYQEACLREHQQNPSVPGDSPADLEYHPSDDEDEFSRCLVASSPLSSTSAAVAATSVI